MPAQSATPDHPQTSRHQDVALTLARIGVAGMAASMPISRAVFNLSALLMIIGWLFSGHWKERLVTIRNDLVAIASIVLFVVCAFSLTWAGVLTPDHWSQLRGYSRLLYIPLIITLLSGAQVWQRRAWTAMLTGMLITLAAYLLDIWFEVPGTGSYGSHTAGGGVFYHHIAQGMMLSFLGAYALHRALETSLNRTLRLLWLTVAISTLAGLIVVGQSRTGQLSVLVAYCLVVWTHLPKHLRFAGLALTATLSCMLIMGSPRMQERFELAVQETSSFEQNGEHTSVGARLKAWEFTEQLIQQAPWLGHGVGSYRSLAYQHFAQSPICNLGVCEQPHNQFLLTIVETGVLGTLALAAFLVAPLCNRAESGSLAASLALPFVAIFVVTAYFDSSLKIQAQSFFTVTTLGLLMTGKSTLGGVKHQVQHRFNELGCCRFH